MAETFRFSPVKRVVGARYPLAVMASLAAALAWVSPAWTSWYPWAAAGVLAVLALRVAQHLAAGRHPITVDEVGVTRAGHVVPYADAQLELKVRGRASPRVAEVVLYTAEAAGGGREVGFDRSLDRFDRAVGAVVVRVPELRIVVSTLDNADVRDARREAVLSKYRQALR